MAIHIRRREFVFTLGGAVAAWPVAAHAPLLSLVQKWINRQTMTSTALDRHPISPRTTFRRPKLKSNVLPLDIPQIA